MPPKEPVEAVKALQNEIQKLNAPVLVIPAGFPDAEVIRQNVAKFLKKGSRTVEHLIMLIHDEENKV